MTGSRLPIGRGVDHSPRCQRIVRDERGVALLTVIGIAFVLLVVVTAATSFAVSAMPQVTDHEDWNAALAAAEAGIEDAQYRLNQNGWYWSVDDDDNQARVGWRTIPGQPGEARYHYHLDGSQVGRTGAVDIVSTGWVGNQRRTVEARLRRDGFLDYLYFTDYESADPHTFANVTDARQRDWLDANCAVRHPHRNLSDPSNNFRQGGCGTIRFAPGDVFDGPLRSNDALRIRTRPGEPRFLGPVVTGWDWKAAGSSRPYVRDSNSTGEPEFRNAVQYAPQMPVPETSRALGEHADATGCRYEGPTYIRFSDNPPRMTVISPLTDPSSVNPGCGTGRQVDNSPTGGIASTVPLKDGEVLYVEDSLRTGVTRHPLEMPRPDDRFNTFNATAGDVFVHGVLDGQVTIATENDIVVVWDLVYQDTSPDSTDLLGLIADHHVWVYHPVGRQMITYTNLGVAHQDLPPFKRDPETGFPSGPLTRAQQWTEPEIHAAILALNRSFSVQQYNRGPAMGNMTVVGAIAQRWRGPVATHNAVTGALASGYLKDYRYDWRLQYLTPPHFLEPELSPWGRRRWAEVNDPPWCTAGQDPIAEVCLPRDGGSDAS